MPQRNRYRESLRASTPPGAPTTQSAPPCSSSGVSVSATSSPTVPPTSVVHIRTADEATALARRLLASGRRWPVAVVSIASDSPAPFISADDLKAEVGDLGEVVVMPTSDVSWALSTAMPPQTQVYGGAGRVYGVDHAWVANPYASALRFAYSAADSPKVVAHLVSDMMSAALRAGLVLGEQPRQAARRSGVVQGLIGERAILELDDGGQAAIWAELTVPDVALDRLVRAGQHLTGPLDPDSRRLDIRPSIIPTDDFLSAYAIGDVILVDVISADERSVTVRPHPSVSVRIPRVFVTDNPLDLVNELFTAGEVILARVITAGAPPGLRLDDIDDDTHVEAPSLLPGGPPWLTLPAPRPAAPTEVGPAEREPVEGTDLLQAPASLATSPAAGPPPPATMHDGALGSFHELLSLRSLTRRQEEKLAETQAQLASVTTRYRKAEDTRRTLQKKLKASTGWSGISDYSGAFNDPEDQFRFEVALAWAHRIPADQKAQLALAPYVVGPKFLASLAATEGVSRAKVVDVVVEVLTGLAKTSATRAPHMLRINGTGGSPARHRDDGAHCWRVALQQNTPSARRLHYWALGETIELSRVVTHDDMEP